jgi:hypothetical protein
MRSLKTLPGVVFALTVLSGCTRTTPPSAAPSVSSSIATMTCFGYSFEFEREGDGPSGVGGHRNATRGADGKETNLDEDLTITCGSHRVKIINGILTVGDKERGTIKPGDTIKLTSSGKLSVNGTER